MAPKSDKKGRSALKEVVTREYTIHLHKYIHGMYVLCDRLYRSVGLQVLFQSYKEPLVRLSSACGDPYWSPPNASFR